MRHLDPFILAALTFLLMSGSAFADCGDMSKRLFGIEIRGATTNKSSLSPGFSVYMPAVRNDKATVEFIVGRTLGLDFNVQVLSHNDRIVSILATTRPAPESAIDNALTALRNISGSDFSYNSRDEGLYLRCNDGLTGMARKAKVFRTATEEGDPLLVLTVEDPRLKNEMQIAIHCKDKTTHCPYEVRGK